MHWEDKRSEIGLQFSRQVLAQQTTEGVCMSLQGANVTVHYMQDAMEFDAPLRATLHDLRCQAAKTFLGLRDPTVQYRFYVQSESGEFKHWNSDTTVDLVIQALYPTMSRSLCRKVHLGIKIAGSEQEVEVHLKQDDVDTGAVVKLLWVVPGTVLSNLRCGMAEARHVPEEQLRFQLDLGGSWVACDDDCIKHILETHFSSKEPPSRLRVKLLIIPPPLKPSEENV